MAFYIKPTDGVISMESLRRFGLKRFSFLNEVLRCGGPEDFRHLISAHDTAIDSECLIEGSKQDRTSHFLLRLACSQDADLRDFLIQAETELFCYRFYNMDAKELAHLLRSTHKFVARCLSYDSCFSNDLLSDLHMALDMICSPVGSWKEVARKYMDECSSETFQIPYQLSLSLIAGRQVTLSGGLASVPFSKLHVVLSSLFHLLLVGGLKTAATVDHQDQRIVTILQTLREFGRRLLGKPTSPEMMPATGDIAHADVDREMRYFPPCMKHLHRVLRQRHRLRHHSRIQYTLFLKEAGLPLQEALLFWKREYSLPQRDRSGGEVKNGHSWQKEKRRYTYNIRHLYGQEGSRVNYSAHSCRYLKTYSPGPGEVGGCPFSQADSAHLQALMDIEDIHPSDQNLIQSLCQTRQYTAACAAIQQLKETQLSRIMTGFSSFPGVKVETGGDSRPEKSQYQRSPSRNSRINILDGSEMDHEEANVPVTGVDVGEGQRGHIMIKSEGTVGALNEFPLKHSDPHPGVGSIPSAILGTSAIGVCRTTEPQTSPNNGGCYDTATPRDELQPCLSGRVEGDRHTHKRMRICYDQSSTADNFESNPGQIREHCTAIPGDIVATGDISTLTKRGNVEAVMSAGTEFSGGTSGNRQRDVVKSISAFRKPVDIYRSFKRLLTDLQATQ